MFSCKRRAGEGGCEGGMEPKDKLHSGLVNKHNFPPLTAEFTVRKSYPDVVSTFGLRFSCLTREAQTKHPVTANGQRKNVLLKLKMIKCTVIDSAMMLVIFRVMTCERGSSHLVIFTDYLLCAGDLELDCHPFPHCIIRNFLRSNTFIESLQSELMGLNFHEKSNDLYKFKQVPDRFCS